MPNVRCWSRGRTVEIDVLLFFSLAAILKNKFLFPLFSAELIGKVLQTWLHLTYFKIPTLLFLLYKKEDFVYLFIVLYSTLLHPPSLRFYCVRGCWD